MSRDIATIARAYCQRSRARRAGLVAARTVRPAGDVPPVDARQAFASMVMERLDGPILRFSMRQELLAHAARLGLPRFEACLIIAQVQHRAQGSFIHTDTVAASQMPRATRYLPVIVAAGVQMAIIAGVWAILS